MNRALTDKWPEGGRLVSPQQFLDELLISVSYAWNRIHGRSDTDVPIKWPHPCKKPGCAALIPSGQRYCQAHGGGDAGSKPARERVPDRRESASKRGYDARWQRIREYVLKTQPYCDECGAVATEVHHVVPLDKGGERYALSNLRPLCHRCHMLQGH